LPHPKPFARQRGKQYDGAAMNPEKGRMENVLRRTFHADQKVEASYILLLEWIIK
jgi:hypothetical protein